MTMKQRSERFASLQSTMDDLLGGMKARVEADLPRLRLLWGDVCGPALAGRTQVIGVDGDQLLIEVPAQWRGALHEVHQELLARLRRRSSLRGLRYLEPPR